MSISAPTSAGKSFVLCLDTVRRLRSGTPCSIVFVVPTRALIRQVSKRIADELRRVELEGIPVRCVPLPISPEQAPRGVVYVLTQERLLSLLYNDEAEPWITILIVDEAQGVKDGSRGVLLQSAIECVHSRFPQVRIIFSSPMVRNPEYLLWLFARSESGRFRTEEHSPVSQNLILVSEVNRKPKEVQFSVLFDGAPIDIGRCELPFRFRDAKFRQHAEFARAITNEGACTILYADKPRDTEELADQLVEGMEEPEALHPEVGEFIEFLKEHIHEEYPLIRHLRFGVAYHYGYMPGIVRARVEELFQSGGLRYICCTSTLLQGVNLPARNIVIENPRKGVGKVMQRADFLNLAGRAGRLLHEFHGNVWCLRPDDWDVAEGSTEPCWRGETLHMISAAFEDVLRDGGLLIQKILQDSDELSKEQRILGEACAAKTFADYTSTRSSLADSQYATEGNRSALRETERLCQEIRVSLPDWVFRQNATILPQRLQTLYEFLAAQRSIDEWIPLSPHQGGFYNRMERIFRQVERSLGQVENESCVFDTWLASQWIHDTPLRAIIANRIRNKPDEAPRDVIFEILKALEERIRFRYVKHTRAYGDVLRVVLQEMDRADLLNSLCPLHLFLECGASHPVVLNLITLGLSRTTSLLLKGKVHFPEDATPEMCFAILKDADIEGMDIQALCKHEILSLIGRAS